MQALAWWAIPIIATTVAIIWAIFAARPKGPADAHRTVAEHLAFRSALQTGNVRVQPTDEPDGGSGDVADSADAGRERDDSLRPSSRDSQLGRSSPGPS
jgi:hypothetical protein